MTYLLHRGNRPDLTAPVATGFPDFDSALRARDDDVIAQLTRRPCPPREIAHAIVGPGLAGPHTLHVVTTFAGVQHGHPNPVREVAAIRRWLLEIRQT